VRALNVNEWGVRYVFSCGFDLRDYTNLQIEFTKPSGAQLVVSSPDVTPPPVDLETSIGFFPANTYAQYTFQPGDVDEIGEWTARVVYDDGSQHLISDIGNFEIFE
jgi:hypothetical protein